MRVHITKPKNGTVDVRLEDRRGLTGLREERLNVPIESVGAVVLGLGQTWHARRDAIRRARKGLEA